MEFKRISNLLKKLVPVAIASCACVLSPLSNAIETKQDETEVIEVIGQKSILYYHKEMARKELAFYDAVNELLDNPDYKMVCESARSSVWKTTSRNMLISCAPQFS